MKRNACRLSFIFLLIISSLNIANSCSGRDETTACFPLTNVNVILNLNLPLYQNLQTVGGWIYVDEQSSGTRGLIVVRTTGGYKVFDRNAPHICPENNTTLKVENSIKIICENDGAEWILLTGEPIKIAKVPPKTYLYSYDAGSNVLSIQN